MLEGGQEVRVRLAIGALLVVRANPQWGTQGYLAHKKRGF